MQHQTRKKLTWRKTRPRNEGKNRRTTRLHAPYGSQHDTLIDLCSIAVFPLCGGSIRSPLNTDHARWGLCQEPAHENTRAIYRLIGFCAAGAHPTARHSCTQAYIKRTGQYLCSMSWEGHEEMGRGAIFANYDDARKEGKLNDVGQPCRYSR